MKLFVLLLLVSCWAQNFADDSYSTVVVTGYWDVKGKHGAREYDGWFRNSLRLNAPYIVYNDNPSIVSRFSGFRQGLPTTYIRRTILSFYSWSKYNESWTSWTHGIHVPSAELGAIWTEKIAMLEDATKNANFSTFDWFAWVDAGQAFYRHRSPPATPWPLPQNLKILPKDKLIYTGSREWQDDHDVAGTAFLMHRSFVKPLYDLFYEELDSCSRADNNWKCSSDQILFTRIRKRFPGKFFRIGNGYGNVVPLLFGPVPTQEANATLARMR